MEAEKSGAVMWGAIGVSVAAFDLLGPDTLSGAFKRAREHENPLVRIAAVGGLAITAAHLMDWIPEKYDPFNIIDQKYHAHD